jgi:purine-binding chemotaxis protein CheW
MESKSYLIFSLHGLLYGVAAERVKETLALPELTSIVGAPQDIVGLLNLHSQIIPVMHLDLRFGHQFKGCQVDDNLIVLESQGLEIGVIVHEIERVIDLETQYIQYDLFYGRDIEIDRVFVIGIANLDNCQVVLLDVDKLLRHSDTVSQLIERETPDIQTKNINSFYELYCSEVNSQEQKIFRQRANDLQKSIDDDALTELIPISVFSLDDNYFGLDLNLVKEFIKIGKIATIPCCPNHIIGNINLRGEILTLIDLRQILNLPEQPFDSNFKAIVFDTDDIVAGIIVDRVFDVIYLPAEAIKPLPVAVNIKAPYLKATATYLERTLNIINLENMLTERVLTVDMAA